MLTAVAPEARFGGLALAAVRPDPPAWRHRNLYVIRPRYPRCGESSIAGRSPVKILRELYSQVDHLVHEVMKFGVVGAVAFVVDLGVFYILRAEVDLQVIRSKVIATAIATTVAYFGNRHWTYRHRDRSGLGREYTLFFLFNGIGLAIGAACLAISHYVLGYRSPQADMIVNVFGIGLGTLFRFWSYRKWVFRQIAAPKAEGEPAPETVLS
jgi:putative flippase GtrA